jgi:hypothetical protein
MSGLAWPLPIVCKRVDGFCLACYLMDCICVPLKKNTIAVLNSSRTMQIIKTGMFTQFEPTKGIILSPGTTE